MAARPMIVIELAADAQHARDLSAGGIFVPGCSLELCAECDLFVRCGDGELRLDARVVFLDPRGGAGLELVGFGPEMKEQLAALGATLIQGAGGRGAALAQGSGELDVPADDAAADGADAADAADNAASAAADAADAADPADPAGAGAAAAAQQLRARLGQLSLAQQIKKAHSGDLQERILLERMYGKNVWEALLRNPRLTAPEVARIARMPTLTRPLIEIILGNSAWLQIGEIRRALLGSSRLAIDQVLRVLRLLPKHELRLAAVQTTYPYPVRDAARRMLRDAP